MDASQLYCLMRAAELERRRLEQLPDHQLQQQDCAAEADDLDDMQDDHKPYFWNRR